MKFIDRSEAEDFLKIIEASPYAADDFRLTGDEDPPTGSGLTFIKGTVSVTRISNGICRRYRAGHGTNWLKDFSADLNGHLFGAE